MSEQSKLGDRNVPLFCALYWYCCYCSIMIRRCMYKTGNENKFCYIKLIVVYLVIHLTPNKIL